MFDASLLTKEAQPISTLGEQDEAISFRRQRGERQASYPVLNRLEELARGGAISIDFSRTAYGEASAGSKMRKEKADDYFWTGLSGQPELEVHKRADISKIVFPDGVDTDSKRNDVEILLTAFLSNAILVTSDGASRTQPRGILGSKADLARIGIRVMSPSEALEEALMDDEKAD